MKVFCSKSGQQSLSENAFLKVYPRMLNYKVQHKRTINLLAGFKISEVNHEFGFHVASANKSYNAVTFDAEGCACPARMKLLAGVIN